MHVVPPPSLFRISARAVCPLLPLAFEYVRRALSLSCMQLESPCIGAQSAVLPLSYMQLGGPMHMLYRADATAGEGAWRSSVRRRANACVRPGVRIHMQKIGGYVGASTIDAEI